MIRILLIFATMVTMAVAANAETKSFPEPRYAGKRLDWCLQWAENCGKPAADFFCNYSGYKSAKSFEIESGISEDTLVVGSNKVCKQPGCDSFASITCTKPDTTVKTIKFNQPKQNGKRIDSCLTAGGPCLAATAKYFCKQKGYELSTGYSAKKNPNISTIFMKSGANCFPGNCTPFEYIICRKTIENVLFDNND